jgi:superoxide reductase
MSIKETIQHADWQNEKHVPVIDCPDEVTSDEFTRVTVTLGKAVAHPNKTEHHIRWIAAYFEPEEGQFVHDLGSFEFNAHGESSKGANEGPLHTHHEVTFSFKTTAAGTLTAVSYCNIHGLWESSKRIELK